MANFDEILFHYTSREGLLGITESASIWGSNVLYLNDASEFNYAKSLLREEIKSFGETKSDFKTGTSWGYFFLESLENNINRLLPSIDFSLYVCSFSEESDLLSQWRGYSEDGSGYSLGFARKGLQDCVSRAGFILKPCIYDERDQISVIREFVRKASDLFLLEVGTTGTNWDVKSKHITVDLMLEFIELAPFLKHPKFVEEREWRIVANLQTTKVKSLIKFRPSRTMIIPYIEMPLPAVAGSLMVDEVIVGPTSHRALSSASIELLFKSRNVTCPSVKCSTIPYRAV